MVQRMLLAAAAIVAMAAPVFAQETREFNDDLGRTVEVPVQPQRVVTLHDSSLTVPLLELGITPVGAFSRTGAGIDGPYMRGATTVTGITFQNSGIADVGGSTADIEAIAALEPDLIITSTFQQATVDQLQLIAPTVVVEDNMRGELATFESIAALTGTEDRLDILKTRYANQIEQIRGVLDGRDISASIILISEGQITAWHTYGVLGKVLRDAGFSFPEIIDSIEGSDRAFFSGEELQAFDADFLFLTYDPQRGETPASAIADLSNVMPGFCDFLEACQGERFVPLPREEAVARSYTAASMMGSAVLAAIAGRDLDALAQ